METIIETIDLTKKYNDSKGVSRISMHVPKGKIYGILGRNGAGKTTIMKLLLGLVARDSGSIYLFGNEINGYLPQIYSRIGSSIESPGFYYNLTATENLVVFARLRGRVNHENIKRALEVVGLPYKDKKMFSEYSLGMKQRLAIANAIINKPDLLILDEPTNGLDPIGIAEMRKLLKNMCRDFAKTILISSHLLSEVEQLADWIGVIHEGQMIEECSMEVLKEKEKKSICLSVKNPEKVSKYLKRELNIGQINMSETGFMEIYGLNDCPELLNRKLIMAGFDVMEIFIRHSSLEEYFKELTGGVGIE